MKDFVISLLCVAVMVAGWCLFRGYAAASINEITGSLEKGPVAFSDAQEEWDRFRSAASFFKEDGSLNEIDADMEKCRGYMASGGASMFRAQAAELSEDIEALYSNDSLTIRNIL